MDRTASVLKHFKRLHRRFHELPLDAIYDDPFVFEVFVLNYQTKVFALTASDRPIAFASPLSFAAVRDALETAPASVVSRPVTNDDLARAKRNLGLVDVLGSNEQFGPFVEELRARFGWLPAGREQWRPRECELRTLGCDRCAAGSDRTGQRDRCRVLRIRAGTDSPAPELIWPLVRREAREVIPTASPRPRRDG